MSFQCLLVTPEAQLLDESVEQVILPAFDGLVGILKDHAPLLLKLGVGALRVDRPSTQPVFYFVDGGVAQMRDNKLTILTQEAMPASALDAQAAMADYAAAAARKAANPVDAAQREHQMDRARAQSALAGKSR